MDYRPAPTDTSHITINEELKTDIERISAQIHETWAVERIKKGWCYGDVYDPEKKQHPCLIAYDELTESEKDMDRATVTKTIKMLLYLGYTIEKK